MKVSRGLSIFIFSSVLLASGGCQSACLSQSQSQSNETPQQIKSTSESAVIQPTTIKNKLPNRYRSEAVKFQREMRSWLTQDIRRRDCKCIFVFASFDEENTHWQYLRTCSKTCKAEIRGEAIQSLERSKFGWISRIADFTNVPADVQRLKPKILKAKIFQFTAP